MVFDTVNQLYVTDLDASAVNLRAGSFPRTIAWDDRLWVRDAPQYAPESETLEAYYYAPKGESDVPEVLCIWND